MLYPRQTTNGELVSDDQLVNVAEHFLTHRMLFLSGQIGAAMEAHNLLLALDSISDKPIKLVITSPGGDLDSAFLLYDTIRLLRSPIWTLGRYCISAAAILLVAGSKRYLLPHAKILLHEPSGQMQGSAREWEIQQEQMRKYKSKMVDIFMECGVKVSREQLLFDVDRDFWLEPEEAIAYGLADEVMTGEVMRGWLAKEDE